MVEIVNLKRVKKAKARAEKEAEATSNRAHFGTPKRERDLAKARAEKAARDLAGHKKDD
jgi:hypothetical protein